MTEGYTATCPYCHTRIVGPQPGGSFAKVATCAKALFAHLRFTCDVAPAIPRRELERIVSGEVKDATGP